MSYSLFRSEKYADAKTKLEEIRRLNGYLDLDCLLLMAECDLFIGCVDPCVSALHGAIVRSTLLSQSDIKSWAERLKSHGRHCGAIMLLRGMNDRYDAKDPNDRICFIDTTVNIISEIASDFAEISFESRAIVSNYIIDFILDMLDRLRDVENTDKDYAVLLEARCLNSIAYCAIPARDYQKSITHIKQGIELMTKHFTREGSDPSRYSIYGNLENNFGVALERLRRHAEADVWFLKALESYKMADDLEDGRSKEKLFNLTKSNSRIARNKYRRKRII